MPHPLNDPTEFGSLVDLHGISRKEGYVSSKSTFLIIIVIQCCMIWYCLPYTDTVLYINKCSWLTRYEGLYYIKSLCSWCNNILSSFGQDLFRLKVLSALDMFNCIIFVFEQFIYIPKCFSFRYLGGLRLLQATCKKFYQYCAERG